MDNGNPTEGVAFFCVMGIFVRLMTWVMVRLMICDTQDSQGNTFSSIGYWTCIGYGSYIWHVLWTFALEWSVMAAQSRLNLCLSWTYGAAFFAPLVLLVVMKKVFLAIANMDFRKTYAMERLCDEVYGVGQYEEPWSWRLEGFASELKRNVIPLRIAKWSMALVYLSMLLSTACFAFMK